MKNQDGSIRILRWIARLWGLASVIVVILFMIGEGFDPSALTAREWSGFIFFPLGVCAGMLIAWKREGLGGWITLASLITFYAVHLATAGCFPHGWAWFVLAAPSVFFLLCRYGGRTSTAGRI